MYICVQTTANSVIVLLYFMLYFSVIARSSKSTVCIGKAGCLAGLVRSPYQY